MKNDTYRVPVFIGVTGHRRFRRSGNDEARLRDAVRGVISEFIEKYPDTEFILLTALAAGADQLAAETAASMGVRYGVVLPMPENIYFNRMSDDGADFTEEEKANALRLLSDTAHCAFRYIIPYSDGVDESNISDPRSAHTQFREVARFISDNSVAGIALWDGQLDPSAEAGTGPTVRDSLHGKSYRYRYDGLSIPETRPIYHIYTPRENAPEKPFDFMRRVIYPEPMLETGRRWFTISDTGDSSVKQFDSRRRSWQKDSRPRRKQFEESLAAIDRYNREAGKISKPIPDADWMTIPKSTKRADICLKIYKSSDALSNSYHSRRNFWSIAIILIAAGAYAALNVFYDLFDKPVYLAAYVVMLMLCYGIWAIVDRKRIHSYYVNYRAVAEGLRVQYYWYNADVCRDGAPAQVHDYYMRSQKSRLDWVRCAIRSVNLLALSCGGDAPEAGLDQLYSISDIWLGHMDVRDSSGSWESFADGQSGYMRTKSARERRHKALFGALALSSIALSILLAAATFITSTLSSPFNTLFSSDAILIVNGLLPIFAMTFREISVKMGYDEAERSAWYYFLFKRAVVEIDEVRTSPLITTDEQRSAALRGKLFDIGCEALNENAIWVMMSEKRSPEVPEN